jgi:hypothetical protein
MAGSFADLVRVDVVTDDAAAPRARPVDDAVTAALGAWLIGALFADGWAHLNVSELESFFTPWHLALYGSLAALAGWVGWLGRRHGAGRFRQPVGYGLGATGAAVFAVGGVADLAWHEVFGIETGVDALVSPSHLVLFAGAMLILTSPLRSAWWGRSEPSDAVAGSAGIPGIASLVLATALAAFFLGYAVVFATADATQSLVEIPHGQPGHEEAELPPSLGLSRYLITTALLVIPLLLLYRRGPIPFGATTTLVAAVAWLSAAIVDLPPAVVGGAAGVTVAAAVADALLVSLDRRRGASARNRLVIAGALLPALLWPGHLLGLALADRIGWPVELWSGVTVLTVLGGAALGLLVEPARRMARP